MGFYFILFGVHISFRRPKFSIPGLFEFYFQSSKPTMILKMAKNNLELAQGASHIACTKADGQLFIQHY